MASLKNLVLALAVIGAVVWGEAAHEAEVVTETLEEASHVATPGAKVAELEAEVLKLKGELRDIGHAEAEIGLTASRAAAGLVLLASVAFVMLIFYMVNSREPVVRKQTWNLTSTSISIFAAVMLNTCVKEFFLAVNLVNADTCIRGEFIYLIGWWLSAVLLLYINRNSALRLMGYGTVYGHILGFAAIGAYGALATNEFNESHWRTLVVIVIYIVSIPMILAPTACLGKILKSEALHDQCKETSIDFFAMGLSYLICMFFRGWIKSGRIASAAGQHANATGTQAHEVTLLIVVGFVFVLLAMLFHYMHKTTTKSAVISGLCNVLATISALTCAWCWLDAGNWVSMSKIAPNAGHHRRLSGHEVTAPEELEGDSLGLFHMPKGVFIAQIMVAAFFTVVFVVFVQGFACLTHVGGKQMTTLLKGSLTAASLLVGLSWEHVFDTAIEMVAGMASAEKGKQLIKVVISLALVLMVLPAWMVHILPKHNDELIEKYQGKQLPVYAVCGDCADSEGDYDEADEDDYEEEE